MPKKSIVSRRRYIPPSIKEKMTNADVVGDVRQYVNATLSAEGTANTNVTTITQPKKVLITNTADTVKVFVNISMVAPGGNIPIVYRVDLPVGASFSLDSSDIPINAQSKGLNVSITRNGSSGTAAISILVTF
tara:strand:+ start:55 stop:453 length:399 start_codon:yes stop_codon:yes gene_type:complete